MPQAIIVGLVAMLAYGLFLLIKSAWLLYGLGERKLLLCVAIFMVIAPILIWQSSRLSEEYASLWIALPTLILLIVWACAGYFLESYRKQKLKLISMGIDKPTPPPPGLLRRNTMVLGVGLLIWLYGAFIGIGNRTVEICALCISVFLLTASIGSFWKYRNF